MREERGPKTPGHETGERIPALSRPDDHTDPAEADEHHGNDQEHRGEPAEHAQPNVMVGDVGVIGIRRDSLVRHPVARVIRAEQPPFRQVLERLLNEESPMPSRASARNVDSRDQIVGCLVHHQQQEEISADRAPPRQPGELTEAPHRKRAKSEQQAHHRPARSAREHHHQRGRDPDERDDPVAPEDAYEQGHARGPDSSGQYRMLERALSPDPTFANQGLLGNPSERGKQVSSRCLLQHHLHGDGHEQDGHHLDNLGHLVEIPAPDPRQEIEQNDIVDRAAGVNGPRSAQAVVKEAGEENPGRPPDQELVNGVEPAGDPFPLGDDPQNADGQQHSVNRKRERADLDPLPHRHVATADEQRNRSPRA